MNLFQSLVDSVRVLAPKDWDEPVLRLHVKDHKGHVMWMLVKTPLMLKRFIVESVTLSDRPKALIFTLWATHPSVKHSDALPHVDITPQLTRFIKEI